MATDTTPLNHVSAVFDGNFSAIGRALGITPQAVSAKFRKGGRIPAEWCIKLERATDGKLTRHDLRPDLYPDEGSA